MLTNRKNNNAVTVYDPFDEITSFENSLFGYDPFFENFFANKPKRHAFGIRTDIRENDEAYVLEAELPGFKKEDIAIDISGDTLTLKAERKSEKETKDNEKYIRCERTYGGYTRSFDITGINAESITASYENGVLTLTLPKAKPALPETRRIEIA